MSHCSLFKWQSLMSVIALAVFSFRASSEIGSPSLIVATCVPLPIVFVSRSYFHFISEWSSLPAEESMRTGTGSAPPPGQETLCSITGSGRRAAGSSLDPYSQSSRLKHTHKTRYDSRFIYRTHQYCWETSCTIPSIIFFISNIYSIHQIHLKNKMLIYRKGNED